MYSGLSYRASRGLLAGEPGGRPCPLRLIWIGRGTVDREITVPNLLYCINFSYYFLPTWSCGGWQSEVVAHESAPAPVWPFRFTMDSQSMPVWPLSGGHEGLSGVLGGRAARSTDNSECIIAWALVGTFLRRGTRSI
jgi:hypothetical protein